MRRIVYTLFLAALPVLVGACDFGGREARDYGDFERFTFEQQRGLGFCPDTTVVYTATLERSAPDAITFSATVLRAAPGQAGACATGIETHHGCLQEHALPARLLRSDEMIRVRQVFGSVAVRRDPDPECERVAVDPCRIRRFRWDDHGHSDYVCSSDRILPAQAEAITDLLQDLQGSG